MKYVYVPIYARNVYFPPLAENQFNRLLQKAANPSVVKWLNCLQEPMHNWYGLVSSGKVKIYSLRDANNHPHISIEFNVPKTEIVQIKGKQNDPVVSKYRPYLIDFLKKKELRKFQDY